MTYCFDARTAHDHFPGVGRYAVNLARALAPCLDESETLLVLRDPTAARPWDLSAVNHPRMQVVDVPVSPFAVRQHWQLPRLLRRLDAQLYHSPYYLMPLCAGVPTVVTIHDLIPLRFPTYFSRRDRLIFSVAIRAAVNAARVVIAVSDATAHDLRQRLRVPTERIVVIPEAADPALVAQSPAAIAGLRVRLALPERYVLYVGSNKPHKNLVRLIDAWKQLQPHAPPLVIAGMWDARYPQARRRAETLRLGNAVRFLGPVAAADLAALYSGAHVFVFPSEYEGFGLPVIEAMACGVPVACSNVASLVEVAGDAARTFDPTDVDGIAATIASLLRDADLRHDMSARGIARATMFSWTVAAQKTLDVYRSLRSAYGSPRVPAAAARAPSAQNNSANRSGA